MVELLWIRRELESEYKDYKFTIKYNGTTAVLTSGKWNNNTGGYDKTFKMFNTITEAQEFTESFIGWVDKEVIQ